MRKQCVPGSTLSPPLEPGNEAMVVRACRGQRSILMALEQNSTCETAEVKGQFSCHSNRPQCARLQRSKVNSHATQTDLNVVRDCRGQRSILMPDLRLQRSKVNSHATRVEPSVSQICIPTWPPITVLLLMITLHTRSRQPNQQLSQTLTSGKVQLFATLAVAVLI